MEQACLLRNYHIHSAGVNHYVWPYHKTRPSRHATGGNDSLSRLNTKMGII